MKNISIFSDSHMSSGISIEDDEMGACTSVGEIFWSVFARFSTCWSLFIPKSEIPLEGASLWLDFGHPESRDKYIKHHCKGRLLKRHPEALWPYKSVCTVRRDVCRKLNNKSVISFTQILFIVPVLTLSRRNVYMGNCCRHSHQDILPYFAIKVHKQRTI
jgi:hypothetical protein